MVMFKAYLKLKIDYELSFFKTDYRLKVTMIFFYRIFQSFLYSESLINEFESNYLITELLYL